MLESNTFSALMDDVLAAARRPDQRNNMLRYIWQTIRECQVKATFANDLVEDQLIATSSPFVWDVPPFFRILKTVKYSAAYEGECARWPKLKTPGKVQRDELDFYYRAANYFVFAGIDINSPIDIAYYQYSPSLIYYIDPDSRPARFNLETQEWEYHADYADTEILQEIARRLVTNWLIFSWYPLILEGALAKLYKVVGDERAMASYALYKSIQADLLRGEPYESLGQ